MVPLTRLEATMERPEYSLKTLSTSAIGMSSKFTVIRRSCDCCCGTGTKAPLTFIIGAVGLSIIRTFSIRDGRSRGG